MDNFDYWQKQGGEPIFRGVDIERPEQRRLAGKLLVIGGNRGAFFAVAAAVRAAQALGVGEVRALLPDSLKSVVPVTPEIYFAKAEASGAFGQAALAEMLERAEWAEMVLLVGDLGRNAETALLMAELMRKLKKPVLITRDAVDAMGVGAADWLMREEKTILFLTVPQLQKLCRAIYYPRVITLTMPLNQLVESLHKFTISYGATMVVAQGGQMIVAEGGEVVTTELKDTAWTPIGLWNGELAARMAVFLMWNMAQRGLEVMTAALVAGF